MAQNFIADEIWLDNVLSKPSQQLIEFMKKLDDDIMILGVAGKMGVTLAMSAKRAMNEAGVFKRVIGVARFSNIESRAKLERAGIVTIQANLLNPEDVAKLPKVKNIIYMAGRKFKTLGSEEVTWAMNVLMPNMVGAYFRESRIVAFSSGNIYPFMPVSSGGATEGIAPEPIGEYAQSCLGRERIFQYYSNTYQTAICLYRLNYAIDLRYGVIHDIAQKVWKQESVDLAVGFFNCIWQGDANAIAIQALDQCTSPLTMLNVTGPEIISTRYVANKLGALMSKQVAFSGEEGTHALLNNAGKSFSLFGYPSVSLETMIEWTARWIMEGGDSLNKPTHFEVSDGKF